MRVPEPNGPTAAFGSLNLLERRIYEIAICSDKVTMCARARAIMFVNASKIVSLDNCYKKDGRAFQLKIGLPPQPFART